MLEGEPFGSAFAMQRFQSNTYEHELMRTHCGNLGERAGAGVSRGERISDTHKTNVPSITAQGNSYHAFSGRPSQTAPTAAPGSYCKMRARS